MSKPIIVLGAGGHAKVLIDILRLVNTPIIGVTDCNYLELGNVFYGNKILGNDKVILNYSPNDVLLVNAIGTLFIREKLFNQFKTAGYRFASVIHPSAILSLDVELSEGVQVMAGVVLQPGCSVGVDSIINTRCSIDHECIIGAHTHIAPGAVLCGKVKVGDKTHVGAGVTIIQNIEIGEGCFIAAGAVVVNSVTNGVAVKGVPAKSYRQV